MFEHTLREVSHFLAAVQRLLFILLEALQYGFLRFLTNGLFLNVRESLINLIETESRIGVLRRGWIFVSKDSVTDGSIVVLPWKYITTTYMTVFISSS